MVAFMTVAVDGIPSDPLSTTSGSAPLAFTAPVVLEILATTSDTAGGVVRIVGRNFGPKALNSIDAVTYVPVGFPIDPRPAACNVTVDDIELTCVTSGGVGAKVRVLLGCCWHVQMARLLTAL